MSVFSCPVCSTGITLIGQPSLRMTQVQVFGGFYIHTRCMNHPKAAERLWEVLQSTGAHIDNEEAARVVERSWERLAEQAGRPSYDEPVALHNSDGGGLVVAMRSGYVFELRTPDQELFAPQGKPGWQPYNGAPPLPNTEACAATAALPPAELAPFGHNEVAAICREYLAWLGVLLGVDVVWGEWDSIIYEFAKGYNGPSIEDKVVHVFAVYLRGLGRHPMDTAAAGAATR